MSTAILVAPGAALIGMLGVIHGVHMSFGRRFALATLAAFD